ncbi:GNAT family N-acetyltransferase [Pseudomonas sp. ZM23]|uniref:Aminoglycoside N(6')-acetyltransferase type 1 n=2 Tax=Pseudomonas triclosanedens TaxID=2961893 RepID=A0ABY6ZU28_9PSED|nr:aminoglycoside 6'-N-acetyltransferase [Pseudomonas triclosanedens]MCP8463346.1 GNAT family N-acetyltransferase [Pseudomonas triclosanedens]MCP8469595.1 GNAT family N-acetyltransferase [Pseudomonas triclosanedens]MCP8474147.1 GNAT family N-acetyltransferase [Pseudomonas triclosanedens]WAI48462.1 GNAT family N-acetyltransferase [Pseudomonas triclosanedens]
MDQLQVRHAAAADMHDWIALRLALWPGDHAAQFRDDAADILAQPQRYCAFLARDRSGAALGLVEAAVRTDYVNGTEHSPVLYLEGIYVAERARRQGIAKALVRAVQAWGVARGCLDFASDAALDNHASHALHRALGFVETERVVFFRKALDD